METHRRRTPDVAETCRQCGAGGAAPGWCGACGRRARVGADTLLAWLLDDAHPVTAPAGSPDPLSWPGYDERRSQARGDTGLDEAVVARRGTLGDCDGDCEVVAVAYDFAFLGGSMGSEVGRRVAAAYDEARERALPVVVLPATGGARMQEGMASLVQMAATTAAAAEHARAGLLQVAVLRDPTTGGVFASHVGQADILLAEPGATIGFAGPRVAATMTGGPLPEGSHTAAGARAAGLVDAVVARPDLPARLAAILRWTAARGAVPVPPDGDPHPPGERRDAWAEVEAARAPDRPRLPAYLEALQVGPRLHGDRAGGEDPTLQVGLGWLGGAPVMVIGMDRTRSDARITPAGYRKAWRGITLAGRLGTPVVTLIDTPGADASAGSEAGGVANAIAWTFRELLAAPVPSVALVIGEGGSGGALALAVADRLLIQEHATFSVIAPEGAAAILERDAGRAAEIAPLLKPTARDLADLGIADDVVAEPAGRVVEEAVDALARHVAETAAVEPTVRETVRRRRWRGAGHA